jgi:hypothetical protein
MPKDPKDDEIRDVMAEEKSRGKRPFDSEARKRKKQEWEILRGILAIPREEDFLRTIRELGYADDPKKTDEILKAWRALSSSRRRSS